MSLSIDLQIACRVASIPSERDVRSWLERAYRAGANEPLKAGDVSVRIVDENESRDLNRRFRQQDKPTNVLAFPAGNADEFAGLPEDEIRPLGDIVICAPLVEKEAIEQCKQPASHWAHLLVHGMLHLLGYDHRTADEAADMETMEARILAERGIDDPYRSR